MKFIKWLYRAIFTENTASVANNKTIFNTPRDSFPVSSVVSGKMKKLWLCGLLTAVVLFCISVLPPHAHAGGILSFFIGNTAKADVVTALPTSGSDSILLEAATNSKPTSIPGNQFAITDDGALMAESGANGTAADIQSAASTTAISLYVVREGDSLSGIASMFGVSVNTIIWANDIKGPINPGDKLVILPVTGVQYVVKKGDTIASIAKKFNADVSDVSQFNGVTDSTLSVGESIVIPNGELSSTAPIILRQGKITSKNLPPEPAHNTNGPNYDNYYTKPIVSACISQGLHGYNAVDLAAPSRTPIYAVAAGTVIVAKDNGGWNGGYGNYVVISHGNGTQTLYAHMRTGSVLVSQGEEASQGQEIGHVGMTGEATGPHLHIEVRGAQNPFLNEYPSCY
jgi:murein DD-endopeptidase MepM/ murein hydrolase activator NlpD